jgi:hypothetical protein
VLQLTIQVLVDSKFSEEIATMAATLPFAAIFSSVIARKSNEAIAHPRIDI